MSDACESCKHVAIQDATSGDPLQPPLPPGQPQAVYVCTRHPTHACVGPDFVCSEYLSIDSDDLYTLVTDALDKINDVLDKCNDILEKVSE